ncbi:hypothetical protein MJG53_004240 [Ovis ammon polii x Ovis aries]|uniref:Uncharacterized protein n=1 Tax=Ovis ammon polii x Ovis aries TaxID=2918886 RepID=A0ACB9V9P4_9CETA|nr:hypothetical protein MJG53_004240 [Ovis ammon polii x Ovis aries]
MGWAWGAAKLKAKSPTLSFRYGRPPDLSPPPIPASLCWASLRFTPSLRAFRALAPLGNLTRLGQDVTWVTHSETKAQGGDVTGLGGSVVFAMQLGPLGAGTWGPGRHSWTTPHFGHRQAALPRGPRAHLRA